MHEYHSMLKEDRQITCNVTLRRVHGTIVAVEKQKLLHILTVFVALGTQHTMRMCHIVIRSLPGFQLFSTLPL
jgi:hypothetical protein